MLLPNNNKSWSVRKYGSHKERGKDRKKGKKFLFYVSDPAFLVGTSNLTSAKKPLMMKIVNQLLKKKPLSKTGPQSTINIDGPP